MKKWFRLLLCVLLITAVTGCGSNSSLGRRGGYPAAGVNDVLEQGMAEADSEADVDRSGSAENVNADEQPDAGEEARPSESSAAPDTPAGECAGGIDVDLPNLSSTMVYSEVFSMMTSPEEYIGKTVKMDGLFAYYHDEATGNTYFACIIQDATACCAQGIEFVLTGEYTFPDDYPEVGTEICVVGVFDTYEENGATYCTLREASLL